MGPHENFAVRVDDGGHGQGPDLCKLRRLRESGCFVAGDLARWNCPCAVWWAFAPSRKVAIEPVSCLGTGIVLKCHQRLPRDLCPGRILGVVIKIKALVFIAGEDDVWRKL